MNYVWYNNSTYTLLEESKNLGSYFTNSTHVVGIYEYWLSMNNNNTVPVWFSIPGDKWTTTDRDRNKQNDFNNWFNNIIISEPFLFISKDDQRNFIYEQKKYINMKFLKKINLCPLPFTQKYRTSLNLYGVN